MDKNKELEILLGKISVLQNDFNVYINNLYTQYENLIAEYMIAKGCSQGESIEFRIPLVIEDVESLISQIHLLAFTFLFFG